MVVGRRNRAPIFGTLRDVHCVNIPEALEQGVPNTLKLIRAKIDSKKEINAANVVVGTQDYSVVEKGCTGESVGYTQEGKVVLPCPEDQAQRCGSCILDVVANGKDIQESLIDATNSSMRI